MNSKNNNQEIQKEPFTLNQILPNVFYFAFENQKELNMTLCRMQEFYESPYEHIINQYFDWPTFLDSYTPETGKFNYFELWQGFNVPGHAVIGFINHFEKDFSPREKKFVEAIVNSIDPEKKFYLIATKKGAEDTIQHEVAHAMYYGNAEYKKDMDKVTATLPQDFYNNFQATLLKLGYNEVVTKDEIQAYLSTSTPEYLMERFKTDGSEVIDQVQKMQAIFQQYLTSEQKPHKSSKLN